MGEKLQELVNNAIKYGLELPASMKPILQAMVDAGLLTDDAGNKLEDLSSLTFAADLTGMFQTLIEKLDELIDKISGVGDEVGKIPKNVEVSVRGKYYPPNIPDPDRENAAGGGLVTAGTILRRAGGGPVFSPQGSDIVPAMLTPGERVLSVAETRNYDKLLPTGLGSEAIKNLLNQSTDGLKIIGSFAETIKSEIINALKIPSIPAPWDNWTLPEIPQIAESVIAAPWDDWAPPTDWLGKMRAPDIPSPPEPVEYSGGGIVYAASGYVSHGSDTVPAMLTPGERVLTVSESRNYERPIEITIISKLDGRMVAKNQVKYLPGQLSLAGL
jgi:hypothetical protein